MAGHKILLTEPVSEEGINLLKQRFEVVIAPDPSEGTVIPLIKDADALLIRSTRATARLMEAAPQLKVIGRHGIGLDNIDLETATRLGIAVVHTPGANSNAVAEHVLWAMMHCARNFNQAERAFRAGKFSSGGSLPGLVQKMGYATVELSGKTLGLAGMGRIARRLAQMVKPLDMRVKAYDPLVADDIFISAGIERCLTLDDIFQKADFVSLHVPYTAATHHLVGARELSLMKPSGYVINTSRGGIVDDNALLEALKSGAIAGAALDVFEDEPPPADLPFFLLENVLLTPHMAAMTDLALVNMAIDVAGGIMDVLEERRPQFPANPEVWGSPQGRF
ncbi:MAG: hydroxyacid dehydrogenase [Firmicutes bacterium]|nr:hydroxyacid dehydrogenase [Bacillota bacterium]